MNACIHIHTFHTHFTHISHTYISKRHDIIISSEDIVSHKTGPGQAAFSYKKRDKKLSNVKKQCSSYFIEPKAWIFDKSSLLDEVDEDETTTSCESELLGKINCPKCNSKLGNYNWSGK